jgi:hypothetical protein
MAPLSGAAIASEFDVLAEPLPTSTFYVDDAGVLSKSTRNEINKQLKNLEASPVSMPPACCCRGYRGQERRAAQLLPPVGCKRRCCFC